MQITNRGLHAHEWSNWSADISVKELGCLSPDIARELSAIGYVFARRLHMAAQVPIGPSMHLVAVRQLRPGRRSLVRRSRQKVKNLLTDWENKVEFTPEGLREANQ